MFNIAMYVSNNLAAKSRSYLQCYCTLCYGRTATRRYDRNV